MRSSALFRFARCIMQHATHTPSDRHQQPQSESKGAAEAAPDITPAQAASPRLPQDRNAAVEVEACRGNWPHKRRRAESDHSSEDTDEEGRGSRRRIGGGREHKGKHRHKREHKREHKHKQKHKKHKHRHRHGHKHKHKHKHKKRKQE